MGERTWINTPDSALSSPCCSCRLLKRICPFHHRYNERTVDNNIWCSSRVTRSLYFLSTFIWDILLCVCVCLVYNIPRGVFHLPFTYPLLDDWMAGCLADGVFIILFLFLRRFVFNKAWQEPAVDWPDGWTDGLGGQKHIRADFLRFHNREGCIIFVLTLT